MRRKTEMERSNFSDHTNYRNIQEPVSAESISRSPISSPPSLAGCVLRSSSLLPLFFHFILRSQWVYYWWGTSCTKFSFSMRVFSLQMLRSIQRLFAADLRNKPNQQLTIHKATPPLIIVVLIQHICSLRWQWLQVTTWNSEQIWNSGSLISEKDGQKQASHFYSVIVYLPTLKEFNKGS